MSNLFLDESLKLKEKVLQLNDEEWYQTKARMKGLCKITVPGDYKATHFELLNYILKDTDMKQHKDYVSVAFTKYNSQMVQAILERFFFQPNGNKKVYYIKNIAEKSFNWYKDNKRGKCLVNQKNFLIKIENLLVSL